MRRFGRRGVLSIIIGIIIIGVGAFVTWRFLQAAFAPQVIATPPPPVTEKIVVTSRGISRGSVFNPSDLKVVDVPVELVPLNRITDINEVVGKVVEIPMVAGEMVLPHHLADPSNVIDRTLAFSLEDEQVMMAFPILDLMSNLNILKKGDLVDILVTQDVTVETQGEFLGPGEETSQTFTYDAMQRITISAVIMDIVEVAQPTPAAPAVPAPEAILTPGAEPTATPLPPPEPVRTETKPLALMLALAPQDALLLKHLKDTGSIFDIVLRSPTSEQLFNTIPVTEDFIVERYQLQIIR
ncbi:MAG: Flp pilus assembly protein CpaB [Anaerolineales bacterium]